MATFIDIPDIAAACPSGLDPLDRAGQIQQSLALWVRIEIILGTPTDIGYGVVAGVGRVVSLDGTDLDASAASILAILAAGAAPTQNPRDVGYTENQIIGFQDVPFGTLATINYISTGRVCFYNTALQWEDIRSGTARTPAR